MAKKHVALRYAQAENEYLEMRDSVAELDRALKNGDIDMEFYNERVEMISDEIEKSKLQYFFWSEAMFELMKPAKKDKDFDKTTQSWYNILQTQTKEILKDDGADPFKALKEVLKEGRVKNENR